MTGAERTARWRQRRWERERDLTVAMDLDQLPDYVDRELARPVVYAWRSRGMQYAITPAQWATIPADQLAREQDRDQLVLALVQAPPAPSPASRVWGAVMQAAQSLWRKLRGMVEPAGTAHAYRHPVPAHDQPPYEPPSSESPGMRAFREVGRAVFGRLPCGCQCHRDMSVRSCERCRIRHANDRKS